MASQIQGLKKVAAANRNKTKSQMREHNPNPNGITGGSGAQGDRSGYRTKDSQGNYTDKRGEHMR